jgi:hypothetical protein
VSVRHREAAAEASALRQPKNQLTGRSIRPQHHRLALLSSVACRMSSVIPP